MCRFILLKDWNLCRKKNKFQEFSRVLVKKQALHSFETQELKGLFIFFAPEENSMKQSLRNAVCF